MEAEFQGNVQEHLGLADARRLPVPRLGYRFQERISDLFQLAHAEFVASSALIENAEKELIRSLDLASAPPQEPLSYTQPVSLVSKYGRLDSHYFMPAKLKRSRPWPRSMVLGLAMCFSLFAIL